jgi:hypothetical protein
VNQWADGRGVSLSPDQEGGDHRGVGYYKGSHGVVQQLSALSPKSMSPMHGSNASPEHPQTPAVGVGGSSVSGAAASRPRSPSPIQESNQLQQHTSGGHGKSASMHPAFPVSFSFYAWN